MPDDTKQAEVAKMFRIVESSNGVPHLYANISYMTWTAMDISVNMYQLIQPNREVLGQEPPNHLEHQGIVTLSWPAAKAFHKTLTDAIARYEKVYGPIPTEFKPI